MQLGFTDGGVIGISLVSAFMFFGSMNCGSHFSVGYLSGRIC